MTSPTATNPSEPRAYDVVVFGATGFVGRLLAAYLAEHAPEGARIALAGRSLERLTEVRDGLPSTASGWPLVVADVGDTEALAELARSTTALATTVGPYARYGLPVAIACAQAGTHYADLTGEVLYVRDVIDACHDTAEQTGAKLVTSCGFDSVPSDLGVHLLHRYAQDHQLGGLGDTTLLVTRMKGGFSGGTIDSMRAQLDAIQADPSRRKTVFDPFALSPDRATEHEPDRERDVYRVYRDQRTEQWTGPFVMAPFNTRIVRRSNALLGHAYGSRFRYREAMAFGTDLGAYAKATALTSAIGAGMAAMSSSVTRPLVDRLAPKPGDGPDEKAREEGRFRMEVRTVTDKGRGLLAIVAAKGDPGYAATAVMLGESALSLAFDGGRLPEGGGVLTPATAMGDALVDRLKAQDFTLDVGPD